MSDIIAFLPPGTERPPRSELTDDSPADPMSEQPWPQLDKAAYHGILGEIASTIAPETEADPVAVLGHLVIMVGNAIGRSPFYQVGGDRHYGNLFAVFVGATAKARKGSAGSLTRTIMMGADVDWAINCIRSGLSTGEGLIWSIRDARRLPDGTVDPGVADKRLLVFEPEFARLLAVLKRDGSTLSAILRDGWDRDVLEIMTKTSAIKASDAHLSFVGHITVDELRMELDRISIANGFANRFLFLCVRRSQPLPFGGSIDPWAMSEFANRLKQILDSAKGQFRLSFCVTARALWEREYLAMWPGEPGVFGAVTARDAAQAIRLSLVYALLDQSPEIDRPHLRAGLALWRYCANSAKYIFGDALGDPLADQILQLLRSASPDGMTRTQIYNHFGRNRLSEKIGGALALLLKHGRIRRASREGRGRPAEWWFAT